MRGWSTQVGERKNKQKSKEGAETYEGRIIQPDSLYGSFPMKSRRTAKIVEILTEVEWHLKRININKQIQLLILSRLARSARYIGKRVLAAACRIGWRLQMPVHSHLGGVHVWRFPESVSKFFPKTTIRSVCLSKLNITSHVMIAASRQSLPVVFAFERVCMCEIQSTRPQVGIRIQAL